MNVLQCPDCLVQMEQHRYYGVSVDVCPACAGVWFDSEEIKMLMQVDPLILLSIEDRALPDVKYAPEQTTSRRCPRCALLLRCYRYLYDSPVELDSCEQCHGIWVEDGELHHLYEILHAQKQPATSEEAQRLAIAQYQMEHESRLERFNLITALFSLLRRRVPPWSGF